ncbi:hypothetical protein PTTG_09918 [Puccinia triticina 1-1 BBBD Race 1]|uniref:DUF4219 domain-containing protein n=1 Tax=Puccinia triticina (isolate 1-1 / race 1 (BBBD)) TaxID=630390 RepID=A0A0C4F9N6_PUCT1|nr:hypothetical protein PTTG_09918 [Puccinia triticina 1-1 BBBD Race 1]
MPTPGTAVTSIKSKEEKEIIVIPTFNGSNYANWQNAMSVYLEFKKLWPVVEVNTEEATNEKTKEQKLEAWLILNSKIIPEILTNLTSTCGCDPHKIWIQLKNNYATATIYGIYRVWSQYLRISYNDDLLKYII